MVKGKESLSLETRPGLSSFASNLDAAGTSVVKLVKFAKENVPKKVRASTPLYLMATAGLRILDKDIQDVILDSCRNELRTAGFVFKDEWASVITGIDEGIYAWVAANYALGTLGGDPQETTGIVELGGASVQKVSLLRLSGMSCTLGEAAWEKLLQMITSGVLKTRRLVVRCLERVRSAFCDFENIRSHSCVGGFHPDCSSAKSSGFIFKVDISATDEVMQFHVSEDVVNSDQGICIFPVDFFERIKPHRSFCIGRTAEQLWRNEIPRKPVHKEMPTLQILPNNFGLLPSLQSLETLKCNALMELPQSFLDIQSLGNVRIDECGALAALWKDPAEHLGISGQPKELKRSILLVSKFAKPA
ncbi:hypothetical protein R1flu_012684 [Riccia fluitans]|uniref:Uncharacterized protein n=1 Tax=Riccia fluitans TaxID=41844 RepID=A0ABD1ZEP4_9MARC